MDFLCRGFIPYLSCAGFPSENMQTLLVIQITTACLTSWLANLVLWTWYLHPDNDRLLQIIKTPEDSHTGSWSLSFQSSIRREGLWCLPNMPEWSKQSFSSNAETDRSRIACTPVCYHKEKGRDLLHNKVGATQTFWKRIRSVLHGIAPSTLTAQLLTREKASIRNSKTLRSHAVNSRKNASFVEEHALQIVIDPSL